MSRRDDDPDETEGLLSVSDAAAIGFKVVEMADRLKAISPVVPGAQAKWGFEMDGQRFDVVLTYIQEPSPGADAPPSPALRARG